MRWNTFPKALTTLTRPICHPLVANIIQVVVVRIGNVIQVIAMLFKWLPCYSSGCLLTPVPHQAVTGEVHNLGPPESKPENWDQAVEAVFGRTSPGVRA